LLKKDFLKLDRNILQQYNPSILNILIGIYINVYSPAGFYTTIRAAAQELKK
jgi:hypothetical protein